VAKGRERRKVRVADLFCGCGGISLGVREACRSLAWVSSGFAVDRDESAAACYEQNFPGARVNKEDVGLTLTGAMGEPLKKAEAQSAEAMGAIDLLVGGRLAKVTPT